MEKETEPEDWSTPRCTFLVQDEVSLPGSKVNIVKTIETYCGEPAVGTTEVQKFSGTYSTPRCAKHLPFRDTIPGSTLNDLSGQEI
jgi:hypothetical protein